MESRYYRPQDICVRQSKMAAAQNRKAAAILDRQTDGDPGNKGPGPGCLA